MPVPTATPTCRMCHQLAALDDAGRCLSCAQTWAAVVQSRHTVVPPQPRPSKVLEVDVPTLARALRIELQEVAAREAAGGPQNPAERLLLKQLWEAIRDVLFNAERLDLLARSSVAIAEYNSAPSRAEAEAPATPRYTLGAAGRDMDEGPDVFTDEPANDHLPK